MQNVRCWNCLERLSSAQNLNGTLLSQGWTRWFLVCMSFLAHRLIYKDTHATWGISSVSRCFDTVDAAESKSITTTGFSLQISSYKHEQPQHRRAGTIAVERQKRFDSEWNGRKGLKTSAILETLEKLNQRSSVDVCARLCRIARGVFVGKPKLHGNWMYWVAKE